MFDLQPFIQTVLSGDSLSTNQAKEVFDGIMTGGCSDIHISSLLTGLALRGETIEEITGAVLAVRQKAKQINTREGLIDTCGTGGDASQTYNISTAVALVTAACGVPVAKHGNRKASSQCGTADVLEELGVNLSANSAQINKCLNDINICFLYAQNHHAAMKNVATVRRELGIRTIFNLIGPLANPAGAKYQLLGVFAAKWLEPVAQTLKLLGSKKAWVVHGSDGMDEITVTGPTAISQLENNRVTNFRVEPSDAGLTMHSAESLRGGAPEYNAKALRELLQGAQSAYRDIVLMNTAAALVISSTAQNLMEGAIIAANAIDSGKAEDTLNQLIKISRGHSNG